MNPDNDLKSLWNKQQISAVPDLQKIVTAGTQLRRRTIMKLILRNLLLIATIVFILLTVYEAHPKMVATTIGIVLTIISILLYVIATGSIIPALYESNPGTNTNDYLKQLVWIKLRNEFIHRTVFTLFFIFLSAGIFLFVPEYVQTIGLFGKIIIYASIISWIAFNWFYTRKRRIVKEQTEINQMIGKLEELRGCMNEE